MFENRGKLTHKSFPTDKFTAGKLSPTKWHFPVANALKKLQRKRATHWKAKKGRVFAYPYLNCRLTNKTFNNIDIIGINKKKYYFQNYIKPNSVKFGIITNLSDYHIIDCCKIVHVLIPHVIDKNYKKSQRYIKNNTLT